MRKVLYLMNHLNDVDVEWLANYGSRSCMERGTVVIHEGLPIDALYIVLDGQLAVTVGDTPIARLSAGEVIGEISFVDSRPPAATVAVTETATLLAVPVDRLRDKLDRDTAFSSRFYRGIGAYLADRLRMTVGRLGYGDRHQDSDPDLLDDTILDGVSIAAARFDKLLKGQLVAQ